MRLNWTSRPPEENLRKQWNALVLQMERPEVFHTWEWATAVAKAYGSSLEPAIAAAYEGDELTGVVALAKSSAKEAVFLNATTADYCDFISVPEKRREFVAEVLHALRQEAIQTVVLPNLPEESATVAALRADPSFNSFLRTGYVCGQMRLGSEEERKLLTDSLLKKKVLKRALRTLQGMGPLRLRHDSDSPLGESALDEFCAAHVARFLATGRISVLVREERRTFLRELSGLLAGPGWLDLTSLRVGDEAVAWNYGFRYHGSWFWYQPTFVNKLEDLSPGLCLLAKLVEDACQDPQAQMVDLGLGAEGYKERFANTERRTLHATLSRSSLNLWRVRSRYHVAERVKKHPRLEALARHAQTWRRAGEERARKNGLVQTLAGIERRLRRSVRSSDEVSFFRWPGDTVDSAAVRELGAIGWNTLSAAAMRYSSDGETLDYLLRAAARFHSGENRGFALLGADGVAQHFAWVAPYEGFAIAELREILRAPVEGSVIIFDCWTPREFRRQGLYTRAIRDLAWLLTAEGKDVWIFSAATNLASVAGIERAGFQMQLSISRRRILWWNRPPA